MWQTVVVDLYLRSMQREILSLELRAIGTRTDAIREAARIAAGDNQSLEQRIVDACFARQLQHKPAEEYADSVVQVIEESLH